VKQIPCGYDTRSYRFIYYLCESVHLSIIQQPANLILLWKLRISKTWSFSLVFKLLVVLMALIFVNVTMHLKFSLILACWVLGQSTSLWTIVLVFTMIQELLCLIHWLLLTNILLVDWCISLTQDLILHVVQHFSQFVGQPISAHQQAASCFLRVIKTSPGSILFFFQPTTLSTKGFQWFQLGWMCWYSQLTPLMASQFILVHISFLRDRRNNPQYLVAPLKQNIVLLLAQLVNYNGSHISSNIFMFLSFVLLCWIVIKKIALCIAANLVFHERTKHIKIDCHIVHENPMLVH